MSREDAVRLILLEHLDLYNISLSKFGRNAGVSKGTLSKLINSKYGKIGISGTILELIANGLGMDLSELEVKISAYQNGEIQPKTSTSKDKIIARITDELQKLSIEELKLVHSIILDVDEKTLKSLDIITKNMK